jgi:hypothetical protein
MLSGVTHANRHQVTAEVNDAVVSAGGWVTDHTFFSNIATNFHMVLAPKGLARFRGLVLAAAVHLDDESDAKLADLIAREEGLPDELPASLNITFIHDEPDLRREVPAVPG